MIISDSGVYRDVIDVATPRIFPASRDRVWPDTPRPDDAFFASVRTIDGWKLDFVEQTLVARYFFFTKMLPAGEAWAKPKIYRDCVFVDVARHHLQQQLFKMEKRLLALKRRKKKHSRRAASTERA